MKYFKDKQKTKIIQNMLNIQSREKEIGFFTVLQNEISVSFNTNVLAVATINEDDLGAAFGKAMSEVYSHNSSSSLLIDANLYNPCLEGMLRLPSDADSKMAIRAVGERFGVVMLDKTTYPSGIYKNGTIHNLVKEGLTKYEHVIILVPFVKDHKEIALLSNIIDSVIVVCRRDFTKKRDIFNALGFFAGENIPVSKVVILK